MNFIETTGLMLVVILFAILILWAVFNTFERFFGDVYTVALSKWRMSIMYGFPIFLIVFVLIFVSAVLFGLKFEERIFDKYSWIIELPEYIILATGFITASMLIGLMFKIDGFLRNKLALAAGFIILILIKMIPVFGTALGTTLQIYGFGAVIGYFVLKKRGEKLPEIDKTSRKPALDLFKASGQNIKAPAILVILTGVILVLSNTVWLQEIISKILRL